LRKITFLISVAVCLSALLCTSLDRGEIVSIENGNNLTILSETEMQALIGGCGSGGVCVVQTPTDCGTCTSFNYRLCNRGIGSCSNNQLYIKCNCGVGIYVWVMGCYN